MYQFKPTPQNELVTNVSTTYGGIEINGVYQISYSDPKAPTLRQDEPTFVFFHGGVIVYESETNFIMVDEVQEYTLEVSKCSAELVNRELADDAVGEDYLLEAFNDLLDDHPVEQISTGLYGAVTISGPYTLFKNLNRRNNKTSLIGPAVFWLHEGITIHHDESHYYIQDEFDQSVVTVSKEFAVLILREMMEEFISFH
ncbi:hypothetical protein IOQ59_00105 [Pontibacterium sp. N1Y112]|uniref:Uncharacterized protein n=1 Tax=Pontibacterium sinense TaxID=2781979 RepID=A0A8J7K4K1_9GAMM|nr:hypothetical protein [Pontibacterium sinense]MBE9395660.1 hypothetical protein [Pontibacterium sinense]